VIRRYKPTPSCISWYSRVTLSGLVERFFFFRRGLSFKYRWPSPYAPFSPSIPPVMPRAFRRSTASWVKFSFLPNGYRAVPGQALFPPLFHNCAAFDTYLFSFFTRNGIASFLMKPKLLSPCFVWESPGLFLFDSPLEDARSQVIVVTFFDGESPLPAGCDEPRLVFSFFFPWILFPPKDATALLVCFVSICVFLASPARFSRMSRVLLPKFLFPLFKIRILLSVTSRSPFLRDNFFFLKALMAFFPSIR